MAVKKPKAEGEEKDNIENLATLQAEFLRGKMPHRKHVALRMRLLELHTGKLASAPELKLLEIILKKERLKGQISDKDVDILNRIESERCEEKCIVKTDDVPSVHFLQKDMVCNYMKDHDSDRHIVFVNKVIPPKHQMTQELMDKEARGHFADESEYPKNKIVVHRLSLTEREFNAWFDMVEDLLNEPEEKEETYTF